MERTIRIVDLMYFLLLLLFSCEQNPHTTVNKEVVNKQVIQNNDTTDHVVRNSDTAYQVATNTVKISYRITNGKNYLKAHSLDSSQAYILLSINRTDSQHLNLIHTMVLPDTFTNNIQDYFPFPKTADCLDSIDKIIFFSYPAEAFGAYEHGKLIYTGATNMGREHDTTPTGLFFTNWKAEDTHSTFNDEWDLKWNFNLENKSGIGWHQYSMPGYPASHSCLRLSAQDAKYLYDWADPWILSKKGSIIATGTPVIIFGEYDYKGKKPWLRLASNSHALDITANDLQNIIKPYTDSIMIEQNKRKDSSLKFKTSKHI